jgi:glycosyltransferase involved in cell wall biosynthesis
VPAQPLVSVVVPTHDRAGYLAVTLDSLAAQDIDKPYEVIVVDDGSRDRTPSIVHDAGFMYLRHDPPRGANAARNEGTRAASSELIALIDDDVYAPPGWLRALVAGAERYPDAEAFGGPIRARFDGPAPRGCGRELPPITTLDLGREDREADLVWSANMLFRRSALERVGDFDESLPTGGDEEEWLRRLAAHGGHVFYIGDAAIDHRRVGDDARLRSLMRSAYRRGYNLRGFDERHAKAPGVGDELRVLAGCGWHVVRRRCPQGLIMGAHSAGRLKRALVG